MHVLLLSSNYLPQVGGVEVALDHLARYLIAQGQRVTLVTSRSGAKGYGVEKRGEIEVHRVYLGVPGSGWKSTAAFPLLAPITLLYLRGLVQRAQPNLINLHFADNATLYALALAQWFHLPLIVSLHGTDVERLPHERRVYRWLLHEALRNATAITACSSALLDSVTSSHLSMNAPAVVISNGIAVETFAKAEPCPHERPYILTISRLVHAKGVDLILRGFAQLPAEYHHVSLWIIGDGPLRSKLERLAFELGLRDRVLFLGSISQELVSSLIAGCEVLALGSRSEAFGIVLLEAMAAGKPVIATAIGGIPELVSHGQNGLLVPPEDPEALSNAMAQLLADAELRRVMGQHGRSFVQRHYTWERQGERFLDLYRKVLSQWQGMKTPGFSGKRDSPDTLT